MIKLLSAALLVWLALTGLGLLFQAVAIVLTVIGWVRK